LDFIGIALAPSKPDLEPVVDSQAPLPFPVAVHLFEPVSRRLKTFLNRGYIVNLPQLPKHGPLECQMPAKAAV
jgi:hypothetical protein